MQYDSHTHDIMIVKCIYRKTQVRTYAFIYNQWEREAITIALAIYLSRNTYHVGIKSITSGMASCHIIRSAHARLGVV